MIKRFKIFILAVLAAVSIGVYANPVHAEEKCGSTKTQFISCSSKTGTGTINDLIKIALTVMTVLIGIVATGGIAYAAVLYASARDNQSQVSQAVTMIRNIVIGLVLYGFTIALLNWLIPGGVIG